MISHRKLAIHYFMRTGILTFFAYYILHLVKYDNLILYIAPRNIVFVKAAAIGFYLLAVLQLYVAFRTWWGRTGSECGCSDCNPAASSRRAHAIFYSLFAIPLLLGLLLPDTAMNSSLAAKKGVSLTGNTSSLAAAPQTANPLPLSNASMASDSPVSAPSVSLDSLFPYDKYSEDLAKLGKKLYQKDMISIGDRGFIETISSMDYYMNNFIGKKVDIIGFVYRENNMKEDQFVVSRFAIQCCSADSAPYGLMVESGTAKKLSEDTWVKVTGTIGKTIYNDMEIMKINADKIESIPAPQSPYTYPDYDYFNISE